MTSLRSNPVREASEIAATFAIRRSRIVDVDGCVRGELPRWATDTALIELYRAMVRTRVFDEHAVALQRTGRLGTFPSSLGQEAVGVGLAAAMQPDDVLVPSFRDQSAQLVRGVTMVELLLYWGGDERGSDFSVAREDFPICVPVGSQASHAAGVAMAFGLRGEARVAVCVLGDGATSKGDVAEALNFAGIFGLPAVFVVNDNGWAISVPRSRQSAAETLAQKAIAAGIPGEQVDGNDVIAVRSVVGGALDRARRGDGPSVVEALTYRLADHTTADDAGRYRTDGEVEERWKDEPVARLRRLLEARGWWDQGDEQALAEQCEREVRAAIDEYLAVPPLPPAAMFDHLFAVLPSPLEDQRDACERETAAEAGDD
jgi:2-oxoisovalerate dehydrogenase E1 component alpha subunit